MIQYLLLNRQHIVYLPTHHKEYLTYQSFDFAILYVPALLVSDPLRDHVRWCAGCLAEGKWLPLVSSSCVVVSPGSDSTANFSA